MSSVDPASGEFTPFARSSRESSADPSFSADGSSVVYARTDVAGRDIWLEDLETGSRLRLTNSSGENWYPRLSPDGSRLATVEKEVDPPGWRLRFYATDGSGPVGESIEVHDMISFDHAWTTVVFDRESESTGVDIWAWDMTAGRDRSSRSPVRRPRRRCRPTADGWRSWRRENAETRSS
jgi:Tol biopolymer transport system component